MLTLPASFLLSRNEGVSGHPKAKPGEPGEAKKATKGFVLHPPGQVPPPPLLRLLTRNYNEVRL